MMVRDENVNTEGNPSAKDSQRFDVRALRYENEKYHATAGVSSGNADRGFLPAFQDTVTGRCYLSRFADGKLAPIHLLEGLPESLILQRDHEGRVLAAVPTLTSGFFLGGEFYTREEAANTAAACDANPKRATA